MSKKQIDLSPLSGLVEAVAATEGKVQLEFVIFEAKKNQSIDVGAGWRVIGLDGSGKKKKRKRVVLLRVGPSDVMPKHPSRELDWDAAQRELETH